MVFSGRKNRVPKPVYATLLTVKVTESIGFWYPHPTNFEGSVSLSRQPSVFSYYEARIYQKLLPLKTNIFLCLGVVKSNNINHFWKDLTLIQLFCAPHLKRKGPSKVVLAFHENITAWLELVIGTPGKPKQHDKYGRKITAS